MTETKPLSSSLLSGIIVPDHDCQEWMRLGAVALGAEIIDVVKPEALAYLNLTRQDEQWNYLRQGFDQEELGYEPGVVVVFGASGAGKDIVIDEIIKNLGQDNVCHISTDWYYGPFGETKGEKVFSNSYDHPHSIDWELLQYHLNFLKQGYAVNRPVYKFEEHRRLKQDEVISLIDQGQLSREETIIKPKPIIVVSGILAGNQEWLLAKAEKKIGVYASWPTCVERRNHRDIEQRGRTLDQCWEQMPSVYDGYLEFVEPALLKLYQDWLEFDETAIKVDNFENANPGQEPARINNKDYLGPLEALLKKILKQDES